MDWMTGQVIDELQKLGIAENTIVIFTSDNGPVLTDGYDDQAIELLGKHKPSGPFRGGKYSAFEAGTRVPMIVSWPGTVKAAISEGLLSQMDIYASLAKLVGVELEHSEAQDSIQNLDALLGNAYSVRTELIEESVAAKSLRSQNWKYISPVASSNVASFLAHKNIEGGFETQAQLYDLSQDIGERKNIALEHPQLIEKLHSRLQEIVESGY
jgi:arylsulfatase A-like enzyme